MAYELFCFFCRISAAAAGDAAGDSAGISDVSHYSNHDVDVEPLLLLFGNNEVEVVILELTSLSVSATGRESCF